MSRVSIVLVDTDEKYLMPLELKFIEEFGDNADIMVITDIEYLHKFFSTPQNIDMLIINDCLYTRELERHNIQNIFILKEQMGDDDTGDMSINTIYKYTSVKEIYNEIVNSSTTRVKSNTNEQEIAKVLMVYSPIGGIGKTLVSVGLSGALSKAFKKVLYINTETLQSINQFLQNKRYSSSGFEKHLISHNEYILDYLNMGIGNELFDYLLPFRQATSALNIKMEDYKYLIDMIKKSKLYDFIVIDTSSDFTMEKSMMMSYCDKTIIVIGQDKTSVSKAEHLLFNIDCTDENKFMFICNRYDGKEKNEIINGELINKCIISEYVGNFNLKEQEVNVDFLSSNKHFQKLAYIFV